MINTLKTYISTLTTTTTVQQIMEDLGRGIKVVYEPSVASEGSGRIMLTTQRFKRDADFKNELVRECGGVILQYGTWEILSVPPLPCNPRCRLGRVDASKYTIHQINDGTTVTLYYYGKKWHIASTNGYSVGPLIWTGTKTYQEVIEEVLDEYSFKWSELDADLCYTIGFRHPDYHPFSPQKEAWIIQTVELATQKIVDNTIDLPEQVNVELTTQAMIQASKDSHTDYIKNGNALYGYILRDGGNDEFSNILIESNLMNSIKTYVYNDKQGRLNPRDNTYIGSENRMNYITVKSYLDINKKQLYINLFPHYLHVYHQMDKLIGDITITAIKGRGEYLDVVEDTVKPYLIKTHQIKIHKKINHEIVSNFITNPMFLDLYYDLLFPVEVVTIPGSD